MIQLDLWQQNVLKCTGNIACRCGRQTGKSTVISIKAADFAVHNPKKTILVVAAVERQAYHLFDKILTYLMDNYPRYIKTGKDKPTRHVINLKNGSKIYCLPTGLDGRGIRGYTIDLLIVDECHYVPEAVFTAISPMISVSKGIMWVLSTPKGREGFFYDCFQDKTFTCFHVPATECPRHTKEFLEREKRRMTKLQFEQEYMANWVDELMQFFPSALVRKCMTLQRNASAGDSKTAPCVTPFSQGDNYLGVDVARLGEDDSVLTAFKRIDREKLKMIDMVVISQELTTVVTRKILQLDRYYDFKKIYVDIGGVGAAVFDPLLDETQTKNKVVPIDNAQRSLDRDDKKKRKLFKEDLYTNLLWLMETGKIEMFDDPDLYLSFISVQYEYTDKNELKIHGNYTHIVEAIIRAAWSMRDKTLSVWCR